MTSVGTLWSTPTQITGQTIRAVAALNGLKLDAPESYVHYEDNKKPEFLEKFASGKIPAFQDKEGWTLFEGLPIARYIAGLNPNTGLLGHTLKDNARVDQWTHYIQTEIMPHYYIISRFLRNAIAYHKPSDQLARDSLARPLGVIEKHLSTRTYFVGERITLADLYCSAVLCLGYENVMDKKVRDAHPNTLRHYNTIRGHPALQDVWGKTEWVETAKQWTAPAKPKDEKPKAPKAEKAPAAPKEKAPKKKEAEDDDDDEPSVPAEPKVKNPLDDLPKSEFNLEDWKRAYSNMDTRGANGSLEWFYNKFDHDGFSIYRVDFKYPEELTQVFMSSNQIGGFFNRLEASRKYLFGSMGVLGTNNDSLLSGVFILRGQDHKAVVDCAPDWESYKFEKLDIKNDAAAKEFFEAALAWDLELNGKKWADGKNFK